MTWVRPGGEGDADRSGTDGWRHGADSWQRETAESAPDSYQAAVEALDDPLTDPLPPEFGGTTGEPGPVAGDFPTHPTDPGYLAPSPQAPTAPHGDRDGYRGYDAQPDAYGTESGTYGAESGTYGAESGTYGGQRGVANEPVNPGGDVPSDGHVPRVRRARHAGARAHEPFDDALADHRAYPDRTPGPAPPQALTPDALAPHTQTPDAQTPGTLGPGAQTPDAATVLLPPVTDTAVAHQNVAAQAVAGPSAPTTRGSLTPSSEPETLGLRRTTGVGEEERATGTAPDDAPATGGRAARRRAERARRMSRANKIANIAGELMITTGVVLVLFVTYQLWWTNIEARAYADGEARELLDQWDGDEAAEPSDDRPEPGAFSPGDGFALLYIPELDVRVPIAEGVDEPSVLDRGMVGRYSDEDGLPTAMPWDDEGNVGLAGHRNTHGEPFRYINRLDEGAPIVIETESTYYVYEMRSRLDSTDPSNTAVLDPVPDQGGFTEPGRYLTLTTCTPEFSSTYRLIVWGELVEEQPRSEGMPDALVT